MNATQELSVNCENGAGEEKIKPPLFAPSFSEGACLEVSIGNVSCWYVSLVCRDCSPSRRAHFLYSSGFGVASLSLGSSCLVPRWQARRQPSTTSRGVQLLCGVSVSRGWLLTGWIRRCLIWHRFASLAAGFPLQAPNNLAILGSGVSEALKLSMQACGGREDAVQ